MVIKLLYRSIRTNKKCRLVLANRNRKDSFEYIQTLSVSGVLFLRTFEFG